MASPVFERTFFGPFMEATKSPDEPIDFKSKVSPEAFDLAMR
jgi:hypothetical protein